MKNDKFKRPALPKLPPLPKSWGLPRSSSASANKQGSLRSVSVANSDKIAVSGLKFGSPSSRTSTTTKTTSTLSDLANNVASGGVSSVLSSVTGLGGGIGSIVGGIEKLFGFGGKSAPPPLVTFQMPASDEQTVTLGTGSGSSNVSGGVNPQARYGGNNGAGLFEQQSQQIVDTVRQALLTSSSLNDVISEI